MTTNPGDVMTALEIVVVFPFIAIGNCSRYIFP